MAPSTCNSLFLILTLLLIAISTTASASSCKSEKQFKTPNKAFSTCTDLPHLGATLHYTYTPSTSTLSMAYTAAPATPSGWVAWAINPDQPAMVGSQALLAFSTPAGKLSVSTYNLASYSQINKAPISYNVSSISSESHSNSGEITIFGTWVLPKGTASINQVWQVGPSVTGGHPDKHDFQPANLASKAKLDLTTAVSAESPATSPAAMGVAAPAPSAGKNAAGEMITSAGVVSFGSLIAVFCFLGLI